jgi:O-antigen/teichoic acid export membrane protein
MSIQRKFFSAVFLIVLLNLLIKPVYLFLIDAEVQNQVGASDYGFYFSLLNFTFLFNMLLDLGITNYNAKNIAESPNIVAKYVGPILSIKLVLGLIYTAFTLGLALLFGYGNRHMELLSMLVLNQFLAGLLLYFRSNFAGLHLFKSDAVLSVLDRVIVIAICMVLLYSGSTNQVFQIEWFIYAQTFAYAFAVLVALLLTFRYVGIKRFRANRVLSYAMLRKSTPYALLILLMMLYTRIDAVMLERILDNGALQAGIYAQAFRLLDAANIFGLLVAGILLPIFARMIKQKQAIGGMVMHASSVLVGIPLVFSIACVFYAEPILSIIYTNNVEETMMVFPWIILSFIPICMAYIFGTLLTANGSIRLLNQVALSGIVVNVVLNFILIPTWGAYGAAVATLITQVIAALGQVAVAVYLFKLKSNIGFMLRLLIHLCVFLAVGFGFKEFFITSGLLGFLIYGLLGLFLLFLMRIIDLKQIAIMFKQA